MTGTYYLEKTEVKQATTLVVLVEENQTLGGRKGNCSFLFIMS